MPSMVINLLHQWLKYSTPMPSMVINLLHQWLKYLYSNALHGY